MRVKSSYLVAAGIALAVALYFVVGTIFGGGDKKSDAEAKTTAAQALPSVQVVLASESQHGYEVVIRGRTESARSVVVKTESAGPVASTPATEGSFVAKTPPKLATPSSKSSSRRRPRRSSACSAPRRGWRRRA